MASESSDDQPITRQSLAAMHGPVVVEFGAAWCGICRGFAPQMQQALEKFPTVRHIKVEDGKGKPLGRFFGVTVWPTFIFLRDGQMQQQLVRPSRPDVERALERIARSDVSQTSTQA